MSKSQENRIKPMDIYDLCVIEYHLLPILRRKLKF